MLESVGAFPGAQHRSQHRYIAAIKLAAREQIRKKRLEPRFRGSRSGPSNPGAENQTLLSLGDSAWKFGVPAQQAWEYFNGPRFC